MKGNPYQRGKKVELSTQVWMVEVKGRKVKEERRTLVQGKGVGVRVVRVALMRAIPMILEH